MVPFENQSLNLIQEEEEIDGLYFSTVTFERSLSLGLDSWQFRLLIGNELSCNSMSMKQTEEADRTNLSTWSRRIDPRKCHENCYHHIYFVLITR